MFGSIKRMFTPTVPPPVPAGLPAEVEHQMAAIARIGGLNLRNKKHFDTALLIAVVGCRLGIDFNRDPAAPVKFVACMEIMSALQQAGLDPTDAAVLDAMAEALRGIA